jgi:hypothetical protein
MVPNNQQHQAAAVIRLPEFHGDSPQAWFNCLDSTFATANITQSITKFHWATSKLPFSLIATVPLLTRDPTAISDPYKELKELLLRSYDLSDEQMTNKWLDYPMCGDTRPSVLWDNLTALQPATMKDAQTTLFLRKLPRHISNLINTRAFNTTEEMIQSCNALWMSQTPEETASTATAAAAARAVLSQQSPFRNSRRFPSPYRPSRPAATRRAAVDRPPRGRQIVSFAGHDFEFDFFLAAVATPIIGMDFLAKFELSVIPAKQQVLHSASGRILTKASTSSFVSPWSPETATAVDTLPTPGRLGCGAPAATTAA